MRAPSWTGPVGADSFRSSGRFWIALAFFGALNAAGIWWVREIVRPRPVGPRVANVAPAGEASTRPRVSVTFTRNVIAEDPSKQPDPSAMIRVMPVRGGSIAGFARWAAQNQLVFDPAQPLPHAEEYLIVLSPDIGRPGAPLEGPARFSFRTEPLQLLSASQMKLARGGAVDGEAVLRLTFSAAVDPKHLPPHLRIVAPNEAPLVFSVLTEDASREIDVRCRASGNRLVVVLGPAGAGKADLLGIKAEKRLDVELTYFLRVTEMRGGRVSLESPSLEVYFNNPVAAEGAVRLEDFFAIEPSLTFTATAEWSKVVLDADFVPGSRYRVTVKKGLSGASGSNLVEDVARDVAFPDRDPSLSFDGDGTFLSSRGNLSLALKSVNVRAVSVQALRIHPNNLVHALDIGWPRTSFTRALPARIYHPAPGANEVRELAIDLHDLVGPDPRGVWYVQASSGPGETESSESTERLVSVSDIGITAKSSARGGMMVWTVSLRTGEPLGGVAVSLRSQSNQLIAEALTGESGLAFFQGLSEEDGPPHVVVATKESDLAYLELGKRSLSRADFDVGGRPYLDAGLEAYLFTDRGVYRPGETVHLHAIVRGPGGALPGEFPIEMETLRPDGKRLRVEKASLGAEGSVETSIVLSQSAGTGLYMARVRLPGGKGDDPELGSVSFHVEEYMPSRLRVDVSVAGGSGAPAADASGAGPRRFHPGETVELLVKGTHLFGLPAASCPAEASWTLEAVPFETKDWKAFHFGELSPKRLHWSRAADAAVLDADGAARFRIEIPQVETASALSLRFTARVLDVGGRAVSGELSLPVDPAPVYVGLRASGSEGRASRAAADQAARFECVAVHADGSPAGLETADLIVQSVHWSSVLKKTSKGQYRYESREEVKEVARRRVVFSGGRGAFEHTFGAPGSYRLRIKDPASLAAAELSVYAAGAGASFSGVSMEKPEHLDLSFASASCRPGAVAKLIVRAPFAGTLLLTTETAVVETARVIRMTESTAEVDISIPESAAGTIYAAASVVRGIDPDAEWVPHRAFGVAPIPIDLSEKKLVVTLASPPEVRPHARCAVRAVVTAEDGDPVRDAEVLLAFVDEGILSLTRESIPDPFAFFHGKRAHAVEVSDSFTGLLEEVPLARERSRPGGDKGDASAAEARRLNPIAVQRVKPAVIWSGPLTTGEDGGVVAEFELPQFTGELRFFAVASAGSRFGSARRSVLVRGPFFFEMSLPRFLAPGDAFTVPVAAFNRTPLADSALFNWTLDGILAGQRPPGDDLAFAVLRDAVLEVPAGGSARTSFALRAGDAAGKASARLDAVLGAENFSETVELPVRPAAPRVERTDAGAVSAEKPLELSASKAFLPGTSRWRLVLSSFPDVELSSSLRYLLDYPHGCIEQTTSRAFPLLYLKDLAEASGIGDYSPPRGSDAGRLGAVDEYVLTGIERVLEMQSYGGWFGMWPGSREPWPWASVYATHFLLEARAAGYPVPELELGMALRYVEEDIVKARRRESYEDILERAYGLYVLALARKPDTGSMDRLREEAIASLKVPTQGIEEKSAIPVTARCFLGGAYLLCGKAEEARSLIGGDLPSAGEARDLGGSLRSPAREAAVLLSTLVDSDPADPRLPSLIERLKSCRVEGRWGTTQENAFALLSLGKYARFRAKTPQAYRAEVAIPGQPVAQVVAGESRVFNGAALDGSIRVTLDGSGQLFYWWSDEGVPLDGKVEEVDAGIKVRRRFLDRSLAPLDPQSLPFGEVVVVELRLEAPQAIPNVAVTDMLPAGLEAENPSLGGAVNLSLGGSMIIAEAENLLTPKHVSLRDDRVIAFFDLGWKPSGVYRYAARAVTRGDFALPPIEAEAMYRPGTRSISGAGRVTIR